MAHEESVEEAFYKGVAAGENASGGNPYPKLSRERQAWDRGFASGKFISQVQGAAAPADDDAQHRRMVVKAHLAAGRGLREAWAAADGTEVGDDSTTPVGFV